MRLRIPKTLVLIALAVLLIAALAGCTTIEQQPGPGEATAAPPAATVAPLPTEAPVTPISPEEARSLWDNIQEKGVMVVGVSGDYPPFSYYTPEGQLDGFDIALMKEIGQKLGVEVLFQDVPFNQLLDKVQAGEIDAAIGAIAITPDRQERVAFTAPYLIGDVALLANADADIPDIQTAQDLAALKIGAEMGSDFADWLLAQVQSGAIPQENVSLYPDANQAMAALVDGMIDVVMVDTFTAEDLARQTLGKLQLLNKRGKVLLTYKPLTDKPLQGPEWLLSAYYDTEGNQLPALTGVAVTANIANAVISGSAGCNSYSSDLQINESSLTITMPVTTRKECAEPEGVMAQENQFLDNLIKTATYYIEGDTLVFQDKDGSPLLIFKARPQVELANITWNLYAYGDIFHPQAVPEDVSVTLDVNKEDEVSGSSGCNNYAGKVTVDGDSVSFELGAATLKACDPAANAMETTYLGALAGVERGEVKQDQLILYYNGGLDALKFRAQHKNPLQFTDWELLTFGAPDKEKRPLEATQLTALFGKDKLAGSAGCNAFNTSYSVNGNKIKIGKIALTRMLCPDEKVNKQETAYVKDLHNARKYKFIGVSVAASGLYQQSYAIAAPQGADDLLNALNTALAQLDQDQKITELAQRYLPIQPTEGEGPEVTPAPTCTDKMKWVADITYDDHNMHKPPVVDPGAPFQKVWRVKNTGTCTWTTDYYLDFDHGNKPGADMSGGRSYIDAEVKPGETYDLKLDLIAPVQAGVYQGFWNFYNAQQRPFAQLWVGIKVPKPETPIPTPTATPTAPPAPILQFTADHTHIQAGSCTTLYWNTQNVTQTYLFEEGEDWQGKEVAQQGSQQVCPMQTTTYNLGVVLADGARDVSSLTIQVSTITPPQIVSFTSRPQGSITLGEPVTLYWDVRGDVQRVSIFANGTPLNSNAPAYGSLVDYPAQAGTVKYTLQAQGPGGASLNEIVIQVGAVQPTPGPTETPVPPTETPIPPTETPVPPTETPAPPTETPVPPTATPEPPTAVPPTATPEATLTPPGQDIININWQLATMTQSKMAPKPILPGSQIVLFFDPAGSYNGLAGCNNYAGTYAVGQDQTLNLSLGQVTNMICDDPAGVMEQEQQYLQLLQAVQSYGIGDNGSLNLYTSDKWVLNFVPGPTPR
jgi:heat shock protein HslJ